jgi:glycosyltransferase involved in cell wall biosynthesis
VSEKVARNSPCPCRSGKRYKDCCGLIGAIVRGAPESEKKRPESLLFEALAAQQARNLVVAETLYRKALEALPDHPDGLHMLGVVRMELGAPHEAANLIFRALDLTQWQIASYRHNLGLALSKLSAGNAPQGITALARAYRTEKRAHSVSVTKPLVSVVLPSYNHNRFLTQAVESVFSQTYREIEIIAIDDGSNDGSVETLHALRAQSPFPFHLSCRENRGASVTLNEAVAIAKGQWIQPLNSDDRLAPSRIATLLEDVAGAGADWGFAGVTCIDADSEGIDPLRDTRVFEFRCSQSQITLDETISECFLTRNPAISTGNLFFKIDLFKAIDGFAELRYHHDWDFCLRAQRVSEPVYSPPQTYQYRFHEANTISEQNAAKQREIDTIMRQHLDLLFDVTPVNPWSPSYETRGVALLARILSSGLGALVSPDRLRALTKSLM